MPSGRARRYRDSGWPVGPAVELATDEDAADTVRFAAQHHVDRLQDNVSGVPAKCRTPFTRTGLLLNARQHPVAAGPIRRLRAGIQHQATLSSPRDAVPWRTLQTFPQGLPRPLRLRGLGASGDLLRAYLHASQEGQCLNRDVRPAAWLKAVDDAIWLVSFMHYDLGYIDLEQRTLQTIDNPFGAKL